MLVCFRESILGGPAGPTFFEWVCVCVDWSAFNWGESELKKSGVKHQVVDIDIQSDP